MKFLFLWEAAWANKARLCNTCTAVG